MSSRAILKLVVILALGLLIALILRGMFLASSAEPAKPKLAQIAAAAAALPAGLLMTTDDVTWRDVPENTVTSAMIRKGTAQAGKLGGAVVRHAVAAEAVINPADIVFPDAAGFLAAALKPGMRAISVAIDDVTGNAGLILPGDRVDLLLTQKISTNGATNNNARVASETVLSDLRVIAVGSAMKVPEGENSTAQRGARTVTLEVVPHDAEKVAVAGRLGQLSLALRSLAAHRAGVDEPLDLPPPSGPVWASDVSAAIRAAGNDQPRTDETGTTAPPATAKVQIFRGSKSDSAALDGTPMPSASPPTAPPKPIAPPPQ